MKVLGPTKFIGATVGMTLFFVVYFHVLNNPQFPVSTMPLIGLDHAFIFSPLWLIPYASLWFYVTLPPFFLTDGRELSWYAVASVGLSAVGLAVFFFWPTTLPASDVDWAQYPTVRFLKAVDAAGNACPSLHVAWAVFTAFWLDRLLLRFGRGGGWRILNGVWSGAIVLSTVGTKQHVVLDAIAGVALGGLAAGVHFLVWRRRFATEALA